MLVFLARYPKSIAWFFMMLIYLELLLIPVSTRGERPSNRRYWSYSSTLPRNTGLRAPAATAVSDITVMPVVNKIDSLSVMAPQQPSATFTTGPTQPEMGAFTSVNNNNMVDLFSGDFSYNIPLLDVGGYPVNLAYRAGISMDQEASWVGLGWNINPGTVSRNLRGLPDDFNGANDSIRKVMTIRENKTIGVTAGADVELTGFPASVGASLGIIHNNYKGWGLEQGINASINSGSSAKGPLSGGLSITNSSQEGLTIAPSLSMKLWQYAEDEKSGASGSMSISLPYNSRSGLKGLQLSTGVRQFGQDGKNQQQSYGSSFSSFISFASPSYTPSITIPYTSRQFSFTGKVGSEIKVFHPSFYISGYVAKQRIDTKDTLLALPAYGYLNFQDGARNRAALLDFNREKELPYREKPAVPHIAVPSYTYDAFSITGEGTGGMFRAYRGDIGFVYDHAIRTKDESDKLSVDVGLGDLVHGGVDLNINRAFTQNGPWLEQNPLKQVIDFRHSNSTFEAAYFRNPGEKSINAKNFYEAVGGDDVVTVGLYQSGISSSVIQTTNYLTRYRNKRVAGTSLLTAQNTIKTERDKRTQVISYLTAKDASVAGLSRYIENYTLNQFSAATCGEVNPDNVNGNGTGLPAYYFKNRNLSGNPHCTRIDPVISFDWGKGTPGGIPNFTSDNFSIRWEGRVRAPVTGTYTFFTTTDDGVRLWLNDKLLIDDWREHGSTTNSNTVNLIAGELYKIKLEFYEKKGRSSIWLEWQYPTQGRQVIPTAYLYPPPATDTFKINNYLSKEKRVNRFRKENHISQVTVLNNDGRTYVYGIPVYNLKQREATFAVNGKDRGNPANGLVKYQHGVDNTAANHNGKDWYYNSEEVPAYAHSFLLTGILSADYVDVTGNGITEDDLGDGVKFNYSKVCGIANPYKWRAPYVTDSATFNEGLKTDYRDDKGNYVYGEKELWYLHTIESKTMIATFTVENRSDLLAINEAGQKISDGSAKRLKEINLYNKADFAKKGTAARPIKTVHFEYGYDLCSGINGAGTAKLTLKKLWFTYNGNAKGKQNPYVFNYNSKNPSYNIRSYDRWGNFKDPLQNPGSTAGNVITNAEYPYALQDSAVAAGNAGAWTLDSIYLPSGGSLKVQYESDDYAYVQNKQAVQMFKIAGLGTTPAMPASPPRQLHTKDADHLYVYIKVPRPVTTAQEVYRYYLSDIKKLYFRLSVKMPGDKFGNGNEFVPCYANLAATGSYGLVNANTIWIKLDGISLKGDEAGSYSPLAKAAIQFLRLNLPSKAYPGSETGDNMDLADAVKMLASLGTNIVSAFQSFDRTARNNGWAAQIDTSRSFVRLTNPYNKKYGGGHRVKRITIYDNWDKMTNQRAAIYGQEYSYTTKKEINGATATISSGVASYEPGLGGEENPFHVPIEYVEGIAPLGPVTLGYSEEPLGESFFPSAGVGYSCVRVRTINYKNKKSANGYDETKFYTAYDFPTYTDRSLIDNDTKKRYKPALANFLRVNAKHYISLSQGFKIELNDMHGKMRSKASYPETDPNNYTSYTEHIYRVEDPKVAFKRLNNTVTVMKPDGSIDTTALIGKDVELMVDMREQISITNGYNVNLNTEMFSIPFPTPPFFLLPTFMNLAQREENIYRSAATVKIIQRYGILDSVIQVEKGSKLSTKDILYDSETGEVLLTRTQNEFNDPVYNFTYPSHWAYDGMGLAYKNINVTLPNITIRDGKITGGLDAASVNALFSSGDEILVAGKQRTGGGSNCDDVFSTFPSYSTIWAIDSSVLRGGAKTIYFIDRDGRSYTGFDISLTIIRSGRRNMLGAAGSVTTLENPLVKNGNQYSLVLNTASKVVAAGAAESRQYWKVEDRKKKSTLINCVGNSSCECLRPFFDYLLASRRLFIQPSANITVQSLVNDANNAGYNIKPNTCDILGDNLSGLFYALTNTDSIFASQDIIYRARVGNCIIKLSTTSFFENNIYSFYSKPCTAGSGTVNYTFTRPVTSCHKYQLTIHYDSVLAIADSLPYRFVLNGATSCNNTPGTGFVWHTLTPPDSVYQFCGANDLQFGGLYYLDFPGDNGHIYPPSTWTLTMLGDTTCATFQDLRQVDAILEVESCTPPLACDTIISGICNSVIKDTAFNPYIAGVLGNWRTNRSYTYYAKRAELDPSTQTIIRRNGTFLDFTPFWNFVGNTLKAQYDITRWVWNSEITLLNRKGFEIENKDPLGRYNAGLYGYNLTMPTAVIQNSRYRESAFEGFEDYGFTTQVCDTACPATKHIDFTSYRSKMDTTQKHSGKSSLRLNQGEQAGLSFSLLPASADTVTAPLNFALKQTCAGPALNNIKTNGNALLPVFAPMPGQRMVVSAWVKEALDCKCVSYTNNRIVVVFNGGSTSSAIFYPTGSIIEGWQRYEGVFDIPANATTLTVALEANGTSTVYFDDLRIIPFNANMRSFVFHPVNLRLMAELDENNYATFYEYDDDGTLIRLKKETQRGIKTIKETRSALLKQ